MVFLRERGIEIVKNYITVEKTNARITLFINKILIFELRTTNNDQ